jgi:hypothetical protein
MFLACTQHACANGLLEAALSCLRSRAANAGVLDSVLRALALFSDISMLDASFPGVMLWQQCEATRWMRTFSAAAVASW